MNILTSKLDYAVGNTHYQAYLARDESVNAPAPGAGDLTAQTSLAVRAHADPEPTGAAREPTFYAVLVLGRRGRLGRETWKWLPRPRTRS